MTELKRTAEERAAMDPYAQDLCDDIDTLLARIAQLEAALRPFVGTDNAHREPYPQVIVRVALKSWIDAHAALDGGKTDE